MSHDISIMTSSVTKNNDGLSSSQQGSDTGISKEDQSSSSPATMTNWFLFSLSITIFLACICYGFSTVNFFDMPHCYRSTPDIGAFYVDELNSECLRKRPCVKSKPNIKVVPLKIPDREECFKTCKLEVVESIPDDITFGNHSLPRSTYFAWRSLIRLAEHEIDIAAYKSSLRGKHVLSEAVNGSGMGDTIFDELVEAAKSKNLNIRLVENYPPKDPGDNEDGKSLARRGVAERRSLPYSKLFGAGAMHSKFFIVDQKHLYLGSANLDWRSLNQKLELGIFMRHCPCMAVDLKSVFNGYWALTEIYKNSIANNTAIDIEHASQVITEHMATTINQTNPLVIQHKGSEMEVYWATSPPNFNVKGRSWDLDAILSAINGADKYIYVHVMDYIPMIVYREPKRYWPIIDDALRSAALERNVEIKLLVAALHFVPEMLHFLKSLIAINETVTAPGSIDVRIFKVPALTEFQSMIARERRTHNKFMVTEDTVIIGTSNWSGDYFTASTGVAFVVHQRESENTQSTTSSTPFVDQMKSIFIRDWDSDYAYPLRTYMDECLVNKNSTVCQQEKNEGAAF